MFERGKAYKKEFIIFGCIQIGFIVAKLTGVTTWHWAWAFAPTLFSIGLFIVVFLIAAIIVTFEG